MKAMRVLRSRLKKMNLIRRKSKISYGIISFIQLTYELRLSIQKTRRSYHHRKKQMGAEKDCHHKKLEMALRIWMIGVF